MAFIYNAGSSFFRKYFRILHLVSFGVTSGIQLTGSYCRHVQERTPEDGRL
jgi:hypothetical protein